MTQLADILELERVEGSSDVYHDECEWKSVKSFRKGYTIFAKDKSIYNPLPEKDYAIVFISPFVKEFKEKFATNQLTIKFVIQRPENIELLKEIVAIKDLINNNFQKNLMARKLEGRINGYNVGQNKRTGLKYRLVKLLMNQAECRLNGKPESIKSHLGQERANVPEIIEEFKTSVFDEPFNKAYPLHPKYSIQLSSANIVNSLSTIASDLAKGNFNNLSSNTIQFLNNIDLLDSNNYPDISQSKIAAKILDVLNKNKKKVTDIQKELVEPLCSSQEGMEPETIHFHLIVLTVLGKIFLQIKGGDKININNIKEKFKSLAAFQTIAYAKLQEDYSYDFAARLLNALGLNGNKITLEKERLNSFKEYKEKINEIINDINSLDNLIISLQQKHTLHIEINAVQNDIFTTIKDIDWNALNISNHTQFGSIEPLFNPLLSKITIAIADIKNISSAITEYQKEIHGAIIYMNDAVELLEKHNQLVTDNQKFNMLKDFRDEVVIICSDYSMFKDLSQRNPIKGKIQQFKKSYIYDFYFKAHEKYVGKKVDWNKLSNYQGYPLFQKINQLKNITCISETSFTKMVLKWNGLAQHKCTASDLADTLYLSVRCQKCFFPKPDVNYSKNLAELDKIEDEIQNLYDSFEKTIVKEVREYKDNVQYLDNEEEKKLIQSILKTKKLPEDIDQQTIAAINKLFKEIDIVEIDKDRIIRNLFPKQEMTTLEDLRQRFYGLVDDLKKNKQESEIRIKLK